MKIANCNNEHQLLLNIASGSEESFKQFFDLYKDSVYSHALHLTRSVAIAEEITQDVFLKLWMKKESAIEIEVPGAWLSTVAKNLCFNQLKKMAREHKFQQSLVHAADAENETMESRLSAKEQQLLLQEAINHLPPRQKEVFVLNREYGMKNEEIAERLRLSPNTVKAHMVVALKSIRHFFKTNTERVIQLLIFIYLIK